MNSGKYIIEIVVQYQLKLNFITAFNKKHTNKIEELPFEKNYSVWRWPIYASLLYYRLVRRDTWTP